MRRTQKLDSLEHQLTREQRLVVDHHEGPLLVVAGPGSGKTRVLVERFAALVETGAARPKQILVLVFNHGAAEEIRQRLQVRLGGGEYPIHTFHTFAMQVTREWGWIAGLSSAPLLITEEAQKWSRINEALARSRPDLLPWAQESFSGLTKLVDFIARAKHSGVAPERLIAWADAHEDCETESVDPQLIHAAAEVYAEYERRNRADEIRDCHVAL